MIKDTALLADALWRATVYAAVVQLHLVDNVLLARPLTVTDVKSQPSGHWGTVPGTAWALTNIALAAGRRTNRPRLVPVLGAGHAGVVQLALAWMRGDLEALRPKYTIDESGLTELARSFPEVDGLGAEVNPLLPAGSFVGGCLGGALAFASGAALDALDHIVVPIIGDGECETPTTAASWLAVRELAGGQILPIIHLNGFRMGRPSLLGRMTDEQITNYFVGQGWRVEMFRVGKAGPPEHAAFQEIMTAAVDATVRSERLVIIVRCTKGWGGPAMLDGRPLLGTANLHKTPLTAPATDRAQLDLLRDWLASYRPQELFDTGGHPRGHLAQAIASSHVGVWEPAASRGGYQVRPPARFTVFRSFTDAVTRVLCSHAKLGDFRVFSPDELASNRLSDLVGRNWVVEVLAEEVLLDWLAGWTASGRRGIVVSYEAFAPLFAAGLIGQLKQRRLDAQELPSLNMLLTSYGWHNNYTHGDPSLATTMLGVADRAVRVFTPADPTRLAATLDQVLYSKGQVNIVIAGKHQMASHPGDTIVEELQRGAAIWPHVSDDGEPDLTIVCTGDLSAAITSTTIPKIREITKKRVRVVNVNELSILGDPQIWPAGLSNDERSYYFGTHSAVLIVTLGHPAAVWGLLADRLRRPVDIIGWREPPGPMASPAAAASAGLDEAGILRAAERLLWHRIRMP